MDRRFDCFPRPEPDFPYPRPWPRPGPFGDDFPYPSLGQVIKNGGKIYNIYQ